MWVSPPLTLYNHQLFMKPAHYEGAQPWHQDSLVSSDRYRSCTGRGV